MNGIWAVPNKSWKRNETKAEWKRIGANHRLLTSFRGGNQHRASQNKDVTDPEDPRAQKTQRTQRTKTKRTQRTQKETQRGYQVDQEDQNPKYCLKTIHMRRESNNEADYICCPISTYHIILMSYDHFTKMCWADSFNSRQKYLFSFFYLLCKPADLIFLRYLNIYIFQNILIGV